MADKDDYTSNSLSLNEASGFLGHSHWILFYGSGSTATVDAAAMDDGDGDHDGSVGYMMMWI